jgi:hypothetical protein
MFYKLIQKNSKLFQVHSSTPRPKVSPNAGRAVPVPNQRHAFAKMEERKNAAARNNAKTTEELDPSIAFPKETSELRNQTRIPPVEQIEVPESLSCKFFYIFTHSHYQYFF